MDVQADLTLCVPVRIYAICKIRDYKHIGSNKSKMESMITRILAWRFQAKHRTIRHLFELLLVRADQHALYQSEITKRVLAHWPWFTPTYLYSSISDTVAFPFGIRCLHLHFVYFALPMVASPVGYEPWNSEI